MGGCWPDWCTIPIATKSLSIGCALIMLYNSATGIIKDIADPSGMILHIYIVFI